jgi:hypothetical protein
MAIAEHVDVAPAPSDERALTDLSDWETVSALSPLWDDVDEFVEGLQQVAARKRLEREAGRIALGQALTDLCRDFTEELDYFEARAARWQAEQICREDAQQVADRVGVLYGELRNRKELQSAPAAHYAEAKRQRDAISGLEDTIVGHLSALAEMFGTTGDADLDAPSSPSPPEDLSVESSVASLPPVDTVEGVVEPLEERVAPPTTHVPIGADLHRAIRTGHGGYSPLSRAQERTILEDGSGVGLLFASGALSFEHLPDGVAELAASLGGRTACGAIPASVSTEEALREWISEFVSSHGDAERIFLTQPIAVASEALIDRIHAAVELCEEHSGHCLRVLFFMASGPAWTWHALPPSVLEELSEKLKMTIAVDKWSVEAIQDRLEREGKRYDPVTAGIVLNVTGGWPWCIDRLFDLCDGSPDPRGAVEEMTRGFFWGGALHDELIMRIGVRDGTPPHAMLEYIRQHGGVSMNGVAELDIACDATAEEKEAAIRFLQTLSCVDLDGGTAWIDPFLGCVLDSRTDETSG